MARAIRLTTVCLAVTSAWACAVGPDYEQPVTPVTDAWQSAVTMEMSTEEPGITRWWETLGDSTLTSLIRRAETQGLDLQFAVARVAEVRALRGVAKGARFPTLTLDGAYSRTQLSENSAAGQIITGEGGTVDPANQWETRASVGWEVDLFGRIRRSVEAADAQFEASIEDYRDVQVSLYAEVAANYVDVRSLQERLAYARQNVEGQRESVQLTRDRFQAGLTSALDVAQAEQNLAQTESVIPQLETNLNSALNRLAVLIGQQPGALHAELEVDGLPQLPTVPADLTAGVPADLIRRRPDIRRAERSLAAQTALVGVATADLYPTFSISGFIEGVTGTLSNLFTGGSVGWGIVPGFRWDLFRGGQIRSNIQVQEARMQQGLIAYQQTVLFAFEELEGALVAYDRERVRRDRLLEAVDASGRAVDLVRTQYVSGLTNFQNLLDTQRSLFQQQDLLAESEGLVIQNLIVLNRAIGGGWQSDAADTPDQASGAPGTIEVDGGR
jgi:NodT family efflux transporter outer membrane factor (OMF) lipoprotein